MTIKSNNNKKRWKTVIIKCSSEIPKYQEFSILSSKLLKVQPERCSQQSVWRRNTLIWNQQSGCCTLSYQCQPGSFVTTTLCHPRLNLYFIQKEGYGLKGILPGGCVLGTCLFPTSSKKGCALLVIFKRGILILDSKYICRYFKEEIK